MVVVNIGNNILGGLATDTKPTNYATNTLFYEFDTGAIFQWDGINWGHKTPGIEKLDEFKETITINKTAETTAAELLQEWKVSDDSLSKIDIVNATSTDSQFVPMLRGYFRQALATEPGLYILSHIPTANDSGTTPAFIFDARKDDDGTIATRPLFRFRNAGTAVFDINVTTIKSLLAFVIDKAAEASTAELLQEWKVSDGGSSRLDLRNASTTDGEFVPIIRSYNFTDSSSYPGLFLYSHILDTQDVGTQPVLVFDSRRTDATAITTRPLFDFRTAATSVFKITPTQIDFTGKTIINPGNVVLNNQANIFGSFEQVFKSGNLRIRNPADTFSYHIAGNAITGNWTLSLPLITTSDTIVVQSLAQTITNKILGTFTMQDAANIIIDTTTGTKIGTATTQKIGFYNATPIAQGASIADPSGGTVVDTEARTAINAIISRLEALGLIATV